MKFYHRATVNMDMKKRSIASMCERREPVVNWNITVPCSPHSAFCPRLRHAGRVDVVSGARVGAVIQRACACVFVRVLPVCFSAATLAVAFGEMCASLEDQLGFQRRCVYV